MFLIVIACILSIIFCFLSIKNNSAEKKQKSKIKLFLVFFIPILICSFGGIAMLLNGTSSSTKHKDYEDNLDSGMDKFINGDYDSATDEEKDAVDDFLDWQSEQD